MDISKLHELFKNSTGVCTDTRKIKQGNLFFALKGEHFNGNLFAEKAIKAGCAYAVVDEPTEGPEYILVSNVLKTLQELAHYHRKQFQGKIIGITGSNGKTTTKELIREVLSKQYNTFATVGNFNNHIGVPLSLLSLTNENEIGIIEMGANHIGEIKELCEIADPDYGIITNIGSAHLEGFGSYEGVIQAKSELYQYIQKNDRFIFLNTKLPELEKPSKGINCIKYSGDDDWFQSKLIPDQLQLSFNFIVENQNWVVQTQLVGDYNLLNINAAIAIGLYFEITPDNIVTAISEYIPENQRSQLMKTNKNDIILDAYNANPTSVDAALRNLQHQDNTFFILGDMLELGDVSDQAHLEILRVAKELKLMGVTIGALFSKASKQFGYENFDTKTAFLKYLEQHPIENKLVLIKGSRGGKLEELTSAL